MGRTFTAQGRAVQSDDGVIVNTSCDRGLASNEYNGEKWFVPWEFGERKDRSIFYYLYVNRGAAYKEGAFGVPFDETMLSQLREDMIAAFQAAGKEVVLC